MFENIKKLFKVIGSKEQKKQSQENSKDAAKERLHLVLMQDRANVSADFLELMKQEIIEVIKKYIEIDEKEIDVRLTNKENEDGTNGAPALYANIPILNIKNETRKINKKDNKEKKEDVPKEQEPRNVENKTDIEDKEKEKNKEETEDKKEENEQEEIVVKQEEQEDKEEVKEEIKSEN